MIQPKAEQRPIDKRYNEINQMYQHKSGSVLQYIAIALMIFGLLGLFWALPFPYLQFLGKYNGFVNWASFLIAVLIYYYLRLSPVVSYLMLFTLFGFSFGIIQFEKLEKSGGPMIWQVSLLICIAGLVMQWVAYRTSKVNITPGSYLKSIAYGPLWAIVNVLKRFNVRY